MHIYIYIYIYIHTYIHKYIYTHIYAHIGIYICIYIRILIYIYKHTYIHIGIYIYKYTYILTDIKKKLYTKTATKEAVLLPVKSSSDDDPGFRHGFGAEASLPLTQGTSAVSPDTTRLYWMVFNLYECNIHSDADLFYIFPLLCWCKSNFWLKM